MSFSRPILLPVTTTIRGTNLNGLPGFCLASRLKHGWGCSWGWICFEWLREASDNIRGPVRFCLEHDKAWSRLQPQKRVQPTGLLEVWFWSVDQQSVLSLRWIRSCRCQLEDCNSTEIWGLFRDLNLRGIFKELKPKLLLRTDKDQQQNTKPSSGTRCWRLRLSMRE